MANCILLGLVLITRRKNVALFAAVLSLSILLLIRLNRMIFAKARAFHVLVVLTKAWTERVLPTIFTLLDRSPTSFVIVRSRAWVRKWLLTWAGPRPRSRTFMSIRVLMVIFVTTLPMWKPGWRFVRFIWCWTNTRLMLDHFMMSISIRIKTLING